MPSLFIDIYVAIYPYTAQASQELSLVEGDVLYILEKSAEDDWWKAKKRMVGEEEDEPIGLVPNNYIEPMKVSGKARALYDYDRQTDEEVNLKEEEVLDVYDTSDPDWVLVGVRDEFGFAPSNYIEFISEETAIALVAKAASAPNTPTVISPPQEYQPPLQPQPAPTPYAQPNYYNEHEEEASADKRYTEYREPEPEYGDEEPDEELVPRLPSRPRMSSVASEYSSKKTNAGFLTWNVQEVDSKRKRHKATLAIGNGSILFSPERATASPQQWSITNLISYNSEKKHVFLEFEHPSVSMDLHAGTKETASEIIFAIGELVGAKKATGLREVIEASVPGGQKYGKALYDFDAQGDDEVTIREGDDVFILDDEKSDEWWMIRHSLSGKEGVVPSSYIEVIKKPVRSSSLRHEEEEKPKKPGRKQRESRESEVSHPPVTPAKPKPDPSKIRTWTDRTGTFKVEAAFVGCADGKIQLHKVNGVKIAVAASKMSVEDLEYVEGMTGISLDSAKPDGLSSKLGVQATGTKAAELPKGPARPDFDWFDFFLSCGVDVNNCQRYAINFEKDQMDEAVLPDITPSVMRMLGLKEGDIIRVSKVIDEKYNKKKRSVSFGTASVMGGEADDFETEGTSLFAGPGGALKNNTRKSRPAPAVATSSTVDGKLLSSISSELPSGSHSPRKHDTPSPALHSMSAAQTTATPEPLKGALRDLADIKPLTPAQAASPEQILVVTPSTTVQSAPAMGPTSAGQQSQPPTQYVPLQSKLVYQPTPQQPSQLQNIGVQYPQSTGMLMQAQLPPQVQSPVASIPTGEIPVQTSITQQLLQQQQQNQQQDQQEQQRQLQLQLQLQQQQEAQPQRQVFYGVQRPAPPQSQPQALGAVGALSMPPPPQPSRPTSNGGHTAFTAQPTGLPQQVPVTTGFPVQATGFQNPPLGFGMNAFSSPPALQPQPTRPFIPQSQFGIQQMQTGFQVPGFQQSPNNGLSVQSLQPQPTGYGFGNGPSAFGGNGTVNGGNASATPGGINSTLMKPLQPMKTGPAPKVSFGIKNPVEATPTGNRKANLAAATPENPFGF
ncbi:uncharacterized protein V1513DRAFT_450529 [Lipomyces chichibuensis]|uniref:uncharacterized protein n=1 Tax=Lipomyces chichibuensis TaxID=1546026 RepID=UPI003343052F